MPIIPILQPAAATDIFSDMLYHSRTDRRVGRTRSGLFLLAFTLALTLSVSAVSAQEVDIAVDPFQELQAVAAEQVGRSNVIARFDRGFILETDDGAETPFQIKVNGRMQARYTGFAGGESGQTSRNYFEIERGRLEFRGHMYDPALQYYYNLDADTDENHDVKFHDFWVNYNFDDAFRLYFGKQKVASGEIWLQASTTSSCFP